MWLLLVSHVVTTGFTRVYYLFHMWLLLVIYVATVGAQEGRR